MKINSRNILSALFLVLRLFYCRSEDESGDDAEECRNEECSNNEEDIQVLGTPPLGSRFCVAVARDTFNCTDSPFDTITSVMDRERMVAQTVSDNTAIEQKISAGLGQRIDGTESEKQAIRNVLKLMDEYFLNEVFAMPEYETIRTQCMNKVSTYSGEPETVLVED
jgi:hypothetical protein